MWEKIKEILDIIEPLLLVIIPTCFGIYLKIKEKTKQKKEEIEKQNREKNQENFSNWEHTESLKIVNKINAICNYYKDTGHMDTVNYVQFENGTVATSKLCNMFLSCLSEDTRFSILGGLIKTFQRIPYSRMSTWFEAINCKEDSILIVKDTSKLNLISKYSDVIKSASNIKSFISGLVRDPNGVIIGICTFLYTEKDLSGRTEEQCRDLMKKAITSIETIFIEYSVDRIKMKKKLNIE